MTSNPSKDCVCSRPTRQGERTCGRPFCVDQLARITAKGPADLFGITLSEAARNGKEAAHGEAS